MASDPEFVRFVCEQLAGAGEISSRRMFGEAAVYLGEKVIGLVCDNQFFLKPTDSGRMAIGTPVTAPPFPGAKDWFLIADLDDPEFLAELVRTTAAALPDVIPKRKTKTKRRSPPATRVRAKRKSAR